MLFDNFLVHGSLQQPGAAGGTVETGQMSSVETRHLSQQQSSVLSQQQTSDIGPVSTEDIYPVSTEDATAAGLRAAAMMSSVETG